MAEQPKILDLMPQHSIKAAVAANNAHVAAANAHAGNSGTSGSVGATVVSHGKGQNK